METPTLPAKDKAKSADSTPIPAAVVASTASDPAHSPDTHSQAGPATGLIDFVGLKAIQETLLESREKYDIKLAGWIENNYFRPSVRRSVHEKRGIIGTTHQYAQLLAAYNRVQNLTRKTQPERWPFFTPLWKPLARTEVRLLASGSTDADIVSGAAVPLDTHNTNTGKGSPFLTALSSPASAVYSEPIKTNLDRLSPSSYRNSRKETSKNTQKDKANGSTRGGTRGGRESARRLAHADELTKANTQNESLKGAVSDASELETFEAVKRNGIETSIDGPESLSEDAPNGGMEVPQSPEEDLVGIIENNSTTVNPIGNGARKRKARNSTVSLPESPTNSSCTSSGLNVGNNPHKRIKLGGDPEQNGSDTQRHNISMDNSHISHSSQAANGVSISNPKVEYFARVQTSFHGPRGNPNSGDGPQRQREAS